MIITSNYINEYQTSTSYYFEEEELNIRWIDDQELGDYKVGVGWETEPPVVGKANQIEVMISSATKADKTANSEDHDHHDKAMKHDHKEKKTKKADTKKTKTAAKSTKPTSFDNSGAKIITVSADSKEMKMDSMAKKTSKKADHDKHDEEKLANGVTGLAKDLQVDVTLNGKKTMLTMTEDSTNPGRYLGSKRNSHQVPIFYKFFHFIIN
ncbi:MAG: hypothetical protein EB158_05905 [Nitrosopumilaceae archaeon]|nr:hypothetical protein [Nitrosopumilaceae archaeon]